jgi:hypothetical protein
MLNLLKHCLREIDLSPYGRGNRNKGTNLITSSIESFAQGRGWSCEREAFLGLSRKTSGLKGLVDIVIKSPEGIGYAIEIDSSNKKWSLEKLLHAHSIGYVPIWIRWCTKISIPIPTVVNLIDLTDDKVSQ